MSPDIAKWPLGTKLPAVENYRCPQAWDGSASASSPSSHSSQLPHVLPTPAPLCSLPLSANTAPVQWYQIAQACLSQEEPRAMLGRITFLPPTQHPGSEFGRRYRTPQPSSDCHSRLCHAHVSGRAAGRGPGLGPVRSAASPGPPPDKPYRLSQGSLGTHPLPTAGGEEWPKQFGGQTLTQIMQLHHMIFTKLYFKKCSY